MIEWIQSLLGRPEMLAMGHAQRAEDNNLGLGWLYYALGRIQRCRTVVVIGSYRGYVPLLLAKSLGDNSEKGRVVFIDPSLWDGFWQHEAAVTTHFAQFGVCNVDHVLATTQEFIKTPLYSSLSEVGLVFIDGCHTYEQAKVDYEAFEAKLAPDGIVLFHDSMTFSPDTYDRVKDLHISGVTFLMDELEARPDLQVFDFPRAPAGGSFTTGLTLVRRKAFGPESYYYRNRELPGYATLKAGVELFNAGNVRAAVEHFKTVVERHPSFSAGWLLKGTALCVAGDHGAGLSALRRSEELGHRRAPGVIELIERELAERE